MRRTHFCASCRRRGVSASTAPTISCSEEESGSSHRARLSDTTTSPEASPLPHAAWPNEGYPSRFHTGTTRARVDQHDRGKRPGQVVPGAFIESGGTHPRVPARRLARLLNLLTRARALRRRLPGGCLSWSRTALRGIRGVPPGPGVPGSILYAYKPERIATARRKLGLGPKPSAQAVSASTRAGERQRWVRQAARFIRSRGIRGGSLVAASSAASSAARPAVGPARIERGRSTSLSPGVKILSRLVPKPDMGTPAPTYRDAATGLDLALETQGLTSSLQSAARTPTPAFARSRRWLLKRGASYRNYAERRSDPVAPASNTTCSGLIRTLVTLPEI